MENQRQLATAVAECGAGHQAGGEPAQVGVRARRAARKRYDGAFSSSLAPLSQGIQTSCRSTRITPSSSASCNSFRSAPKYLSAAGPGDASTTK